MASAADFDRMVRPELGTCLRTARLILQDEHAAEDAVQEGLIRAWQAWPRYDQGRPLRPWLLRIVSREAMRWRGRWGHRWHSPLSEEIAAAGSAESQRDLADLFARLSRQDRAVLVLRYLWGYSISETAEILQIKEKTVSSRTQRASSRAAAAWQGNGA
jgi:RNA polymerase sigma-70 factor (ECF subfamily)